jgi:hypothetical protein
MLVEQVLIRGISSSSPYETTLLVALTGPGGFEHKDQNVISVMLFACLPFVIRPGKTVSVHEWKTRLVCTRIIFFFSPEMQIKLED